MSNKAAVIQRGKDYLKNKFPLATIRRKPRAQVTGPLSPVNILKIIRDSLDLAIEYSEFTQQVDTKVTNYVNEVRKSTGLVNSWDKPKTSSDTPKRPNFYKPTPATEPAEQKTWRARVAEWIANFVGPDGNAEDYSRAYRDAYRQLMFRCGVDVVARARNFARSFERNGQAVPSENEPIDFVARLGYMEQLFRIVCEIYPSPGVDPAMKSEPVFEDGTQIGYQGPQDEVRQALLANAAKD